MDSNSEEKAIQSSPDAEKGEKTLDNGLHHVTTEKVEESAIDILQLVNEDDPDHPLHWPAWKKWVITAIYCLLQVFVTITSTSYVSAEFLIEEKFNTSNVQVVTLGQSMFIGCALPKNLPMLIIFQFLSGTAGSTAVSNVAGTIADLFGHSDEAGQAMALFVWAANAGPSLGSPIGEWIADNANMGLPWIFWINVIIGGVFAFGLCFVPETLPRVVISRAVKSRGTTDANELAVTQTSLAILNEIRFVTTMAFRIMLFEPIVTFLAIYNGFAYGLLFLYLDGVFDVFAVNNGLSYIEADLTYLNFIVGVTIMFCFMPVQTYFFKRDRLKHGHVRPEARFLTSLVAVWGFPISLLWFGFTSNGKTSYWSPVIAGTLLGFSDPLLYLGMLNYITDAYPNVAASAIAAFVIPSFAIAAAFAHIGIIMFENMSTTWAMATLGFVSLSIVALVYILYFYGLQLRKMSKLARSF
ncbi:MAG: hypothetical protein M1834_006085 [Cirrosporium novae-zelandiae]|nr:MAG: hypothetical protein M1834_006085 [Cirrosporium novae-zelandiae]